MLCPAFSLLTQSLAAGLQSLLQYEGDVAEDFCYTFQVSMAVSVGVGTLVPYWNGLIICVCCA